MWFGVPAQDVEAWRLAVKLKPPGDAQLIAERVRGFAHRSMIRLAAADAKWACHARPSRHGFGIALTP